MPLTPDRATSPALTHAEWPRLPETAWPRHLRALALRKVAVVLVNPGTVDLSRWLTAVRAQRLVAGIRRTVGSLDRAELRRWAGRGPLLLALASGPQDGPEAWHSLRQVLATTRDPHLRIGLLDVPLCHAGPLRPDVALRPTRLGSTDPRCLDCGARERCPGPTTAEQQVIPLPKPISNQFDLLQTADGTGQVRLDDGRSFSCDPHTWSQPDVQAAIAKGQLYLDVSDKARLDDFASDLRLLQPVAPPVWHVAPQQPFAQEEDLLRGHLRDVEGLVVDIGAGPIRYLEDLRQVMRDGHLRYLAVEPDPDHLARAHAELPEAHMVQGTGEHLPLQDACADAVLFLRSVNHLHDLARGLREAARILKPGGTLLLVDNVTFGLLRTPQQLARAHAIPLEQTPFEHFRNVDAPDVVQLLHQELGDSVRIDACHAVHPGRSNQWLVRATLRPGGASSS